MTCSSAQLPRHRAGMNRFETRELRKKDANQMGATIGRVAGKAPSDKSAFKSYLLCCLPSYVVFSL